MGNLLSSWSSGGTVSSFFSSDSSIGSSTTSLPTILSKTFLAAACLASFLERPVPRAKN